MDSNLRFAIIDGHRHFHPLMRGILRSMGFRKVDSFIDGFEARDHLMTTYTDFAFLDVSLGDGNGLDLLHALRHVTLANPAMPIVLLTSLTSKSIIEQAMTLGADYVMAKPISPKSLGQRFPALMSRPATYIKTASGYFGPDPKLGWKKGIPQKLIDVDDLEAEQERLAPRHHHLDPALGGIEEDDLFFLD